MVCEFGRSKAKISPTTLQLQFHGPSSLFAFHPVMKCWDLVSIYLPGAFDCELARVSVSFGVLPFHLQWFLMLMTVTSNFGIGWIFWIIFYTVLFVHSFGLVLGVYALCDMSETATKRMIRYLSGAMSRISLIWLLDHYTSHLWRMSLRTLSTHRLELWLMLGIARTLSWVYPTENILKICTVRLSLYLGTFGRFVATLVYLET